MAMKFLIVDDSRAIQTIVRRAVQRAGFIDCEFQSAISGVEALQILDGWPADMVITDWHMPGMSGLELLRKLRDKYTPGLKVGFVTTESAKANIDEARQLGALFFLGKPFEDDELARLLKDSIGQSAPVSDKAASPPSSTVEPCVTVAGLTEVSSLLGSVLKKRAVVSALARGNTDELRLPSVVGLYSLDGSTSIRGLSLLDYKAVALLGGGVNDSVQDTERTMAAKELPREIFDRASIVLAQQMPSLFKSSDGRKLCLVRTQLLKQQIPQLLEIMRRSPYRNDFSIARHSLPPGQLTLMSK